MPRLSGHTLSVKDDADPSADEMRAFLKDRWATLLPTEYGESLYETGTSFDVEEAIFWFATMYHGDRRSNLYSVLLTSEYRPSLVAREPEPETVAAEMLADLIEEYVKLKGLSIVRKSPEPYRIMKRRASETREWRSISLSVLVRHLASTGPFLARICVRTARL